MALKPCPHCGHPISEKAEKCPCCHQDPHLSPEVLAQRSAAKKAKRKRVLRIVIPSVVVAAAVVLAALFLLPDFQRYQNAKKQMDAGEYLDAIENFDALGDYLSAADLSLQCKAKAINRGIVSDASIASQYATELVSGGYQSGSGVIPGTVLWYQTDDQLIEAQNLQEVDDICAYVGCQKPRATGSYACSTHTCGRSDCPNPVAVGQPVCKDHLYMVCKHPGCRKIVTRGQYCPAHTDKTDYTNYTAYTAPVTPAVTSENSNTTTAQNTATATGGNENTAPAQQESPVQQQPNDQTTTVTTPVQQPDNSAQQDEKTPSSGQERKVRVYNSETGQWEWVSPDLSGGSSGTTTENPHKGQKYVRAYNSETGTWDWMWVDD